MEIQHLTSGDVLCIHESLGGTIQDCNADALRDVIEAVLKLDEYGFPVYPEIFTKASAYLTEIMQRQPFSSGNRITAWFTAKTFLKLNGVEIVATAEDIHHLLDGIGEGDCGEDEIVQFFLNHTKFDDPPKPRRGLWEHD